MCCPWACVTLSHKWSGAAVEETNEGHASCGRSLKECNACDNRFQFSSAFEKHTSLHGVQCTLLHIKQHISRSCGFSWKLCSISRNIMELKNCSCKHSGTQFQWMDPCLLQYYTHAVLMSVCVEHRKSDIALDTQRVKVGEYHSAKIKLHVYMDLTLFIQNGGLKEGILVPWWKKKKKKIIR